MNEALNKLNNLQIEIHPHDKAELPDEYQSTLMFCEVSSLIKINFYGAPMSDCGAFYKLLNVIVDPDVSPYIKSLRFSSPDQGANGTNEWDFSTIVNSETFFPNLTSFYVKGTQLEHHNRSIISENSYEENGMIAGLIRKMPNLLSLSVPSAPNQAFFQIKPHPLNILIVQAGYDTQDFILNLSRSSCFSNLRFLDFTDYQETYIENYELSCTPFDHYKELFLSEGFDEMRKVVLRNPLLSPEEINELKSLKQGVLLMLIRTSSEYA